MRSGSNVEAKRPVEARTAVVLNANARKGSKWMQKAIRRHIPPENVYMTRSSEEARDATREIVSRGFDTVLAGGGDGTVALLVDNLCRSVDELRNDSGEAPPLPDIGVLRLGTGNALASHVGAGRVGNDLATLSGYSPGCSIPLNLIEVSDRLSFFAGTGFDALLVNDYTSFKERLPGPLSRRLLQGLPGYWACALSSTIPKLLSGRPIPDVKVINLGQRAYRLDSRGQVTEQLGPGDVLYEGRCLMASVGTMPFYGFGMRMFPWACDRSGYMQLRVGYAHPLTALSKVRSLFQGSFSHPGVADFHATDLRLEFEAEAPFHVAGDAEGWRKTVRLKVSKHTISLVHVA